MSIESGMPSNHLFLCRPLLLLPSIFPIIKVFSNKSVLHIRWPMYWSFSFNIIPSKEYSGLISFRIDLFDLLGQTRDSQEALQHYSSKASILQPLAFFMVSLAPTSIHDFTTGKTIALTRQNFVGKVMSLLFNTLSRFFIAIHPVQFSSVTQLCPTLCYPMNCSTPGLPVHHQLPEFTQTHVHRVSDAIQPSYPRRKHLLISWL